MLQRLSCPWCEMMKVGGLFFEDFEQQSGVLSEFEKFRCLKNIEDIYFLFWSKYNMEAILLILLFKQELHLTLSQVNFYSSDSCQASIARVAKTHREGNTCKLSLKKKQLPWTNPWKVLQSQKKIFAKNQTLRLGSFLTFKFGERDWNVNIPPSQKQNISSLRRVTKCLASVLFEKDNLQSLRCGVHVLPHCGPTNHRLRHGANLKPWSQWVGLPRLPVFWHEDIDIRKKIAKMWWIIGSSFIPWRFITMLHFHGSFGSSQVAFTSTTAQEGFTS